MMSYDYPHPVSRTYEYKKITKPLLERKRRARINRCLDELKDLMVDALETEGENISKLEKADILELTVRHLQRLQASRPSGLSTTGVGPAEDGVAESRWQSGFGHCAAEACRFLSALPGEAAERLARHLAAGLQSARASPKLEGVVPTLASLERTANLVSPRSTASPIGAPPSSPASSQRLLMPKTPQQELELELKLDSTEATTTLTALATPVKLHPAAIAVAAPVPSETPGPVPGPAVGAVESGILVQCKSVPNSRRERDRQGMTRRSENCDKEFSLMRKVEEEEEEEIDVENVDDTDPMWRPW